MLQPFFKIITEALADVKINIDTILNTTYDNRPAVLIATDSQDRVAMLFSAPESVDEDSITTEPKQTQTNVNGESTEALETKEEDTQEEVTPGHDKEETQPDLIDKKTLKQFTTKLEQQVITD